MNNICHNVCNFCLHCQGPWNPHQCLLTTNKFLLHARYFLPPEFPSYILCFSFFDLILLKNSWFTMLCWFLIYSKMIRFYIYIHTHTHIYISSFSYSFPLWFILVACAVQEDLVVYPSCIYSSASANPRLPILSSPICFS